MADRDLLGAERRASVLFVTWRNLHTLCSYFNPMSESGRPLAAQHHLAKFVGSPRKNVHVEPGDQTLQFLQSSRNNDRQPCSGGRVEWKCKSQGRLLDGRAHHALVQYWRALMVIHLLSRPCASFLLPDSCSSSMSIWMREPAGAVCLLPCSGAGFSCRAFKRWDVAECVLERRR